MNNLAISKARSALLIIDIQDRLASAMPSDVRASVERNVAVLCEAARRFQLPVVVSEQYPKGLGSTTESVAAALSSLGDSVHRFEKTEFSVCDAAPFEPLQRDLDRDQWIVTGMECHVCVYQSVRALRAAGNSVHVVADAVCSRSKDNWQRGLSLVEHAGAVVTSTEVVVFDLLRKAGGDDFKALSKLIR